MLTTALQRPLLLFKRVAKDLPGVMKLMKVRLVCSLEYEGPIGRVSE